jgi:hypothetical protein
MAEIDVQTKMIINFCEGNIAFEELSEEVKSILITSEFVNEQGDFTKIGKTYRSAVIAKPKPGSGPDLDLDMIKP